MWLQCFWHFVCVFSVKIAYFHFFGGPKTLPFFWKMLFYLSFGTMQLAQNAFSLLASVSCVCFCQPSPSKSHQSGWSLVACVFPGKIICFHLFMVSTTSVFFNTWYFFEVIFVKTRAIFFVHHFFNRFNSLPAVINRFGTWEYVNLHCHARMRCSIWGDLELKLAGMFFLRWTQTLSMVPVCTERGQFRKQTVLSNSPALWLTEKWCMENCTEMRG